MSLPSNPITIETRQVTNPAPSSLQSNLSESVTQTSSATWPALLPLAQTLCHGQDHPKGTLYIVATPIGNLADISLRALYILALADTVACEDTRHTLPLLRRYGIDKTSNQILSLHQHNERQSTEQVLTRLAAGQRVAYVSDAGTPAVSDPGARLVAATIQAGYRVIPLPGCSSVTAALCASGATSEMMGEAAGFVFAGFVPIKAKERESHILQWANSKTPTVIFETPHRIEATCKALAPLGIQPITVCRELTKQHEQIVTMAAKDAPTWLNAHANHSRGEFVIVIHPSPSGNTNTDATLQGVTKLLTQLLAHIPLKTAVQIVSEHTGVAKNIVYDTALRLRGTD